MADQRGFLKLAHGFPEHPKVDAVGGDAAWLYICALAYCARNTTDGLIPVGIIGRLSDRENPHELASKLVEVGLWHSASSTCERCGEVPSDKRLIHDYLQHQQSAAKIKEISEKRAIAGQKGGNAKVANAEAASKMPSKVPSKRLPEQEQEEEQEEETTTNSSSSPAAPGDGPAAKAGAKRAKTDEPIEPDQFDKFWKAYPRRVARLDAVRAWNKALRAGTDPAVIIAAADFYALERKMQDPKYTKHPATWLNAACWQDEPDPAYKPPLRVGAHAPWHNPEDPSDYYGDI